MTVETDLMTVLEPLVNSRVYPITAPDNVRTPYIVYQQIGGRPLTFLDRTIASKKHGRFQLNWWAKTKAETSALATQIYSAMLLSELFQAEPLEEPFDVDGSAVDLYGMQMDFGIWSDR